MRFPTLRVLCAAPVAAFLLGFPFAATPAAGGEPKAQEIHAGCVYTPLVSGVTQSTAASVQATFNQQRPFWTAVGVRPSAGDDWDMRLFGAMLPAPDCVTDELTVSGQGGDIVDFVVGDFHHDTFGTRIAEFFPFSGVGPATIEWDSADSITVNDLGTTKTTGANDVLECFDVFLVGGKTYGITIASSGNAAIELLLYRNPGPAPVWWARAEAQFVGLVATSQGASTNYTAQESNWYAIVVVNDNGLAGQYTFDVIEATAGVAEGPTLGTRLVGIAPNPAGANTRVRFELARAGTVALELVDVAGRVRSRFDVGAREAGPSEATWNPGSGVAHAGPGAGVYFLRLVVDGRPAGVERIVLL